MKTVFLLRHAKSDWSDPSLDDFNRPLNERGQAAAPRMAAFMAAEGFKPDLALVSTSRRTLETWAAVREAFPQPPKEDLRPSLYLAHAVALLSILRALDDDVSRVLLIGHNPGLHDLLLDLASPDQKKRGKASLERAVAKFPTGALAVLKFDTDRWRDLTSQSGALMGFFTPRDL